jgi:DNA-binding NtrC family response regulator
LRLKPGALDDEIRLAAQRVALVILAIHAVREGAYDYLVKPFSPDTLKMAIDRCAAKRHLSKELEREKTLRAELNRAYIELSQMQKVRDLFGQFTTHESLPNFKVQFDSG